MESGAAICPTSYSKDELDKFYSSLNSYIKELRIDKISEILKEFKMHIFSGYTINTDYFNNLLIPLFFKLCQTNVSSIKLDILQIFAFISSTNFDNSYQFNNFDFYFQFIFYESEEIILLSLYCIHNFCIRNIQNRNYALSKLPISQLITEFICNTDHLIDTRLISFDILAVYSYFGIHDSDDFSITLDISKTMLESNCEDFYSCSLWVIYFLCKSSSTFITQVPFPYLIDLMLYSSNPSELIPALKIMKISIAIERKRPNI